MKRLNLLKSISLWLVLILTTCVDEDICPPYTPEDTPVTFKLQMPGTHAVAAATTGLTEEEENSINDLAILLFNTNAAGQQVCQYFFGELTPTAVSGSDNQEYTVTTRLPIGSFHLMLLANLPPNTLTDAGTVGKLRTDIESTLQFAMTATWDITDHEGFPMWGMSEGEINIPATPTNTGPILMMRMLARINLSVTDDMQEFIKIKNIKLHNPSSRGQVIPAEANLDRTTTPGYIRAIAPTLPLNSAGNPDPGLLSTPWEYTSADIEDEAYLYNTLYVLEGFDPAGLQDDEYAWLEVTATYKDNDEKSYRIDFRLQSSDGSYTPLGLLRNHTYDITIMGMNETEEDIEVEVHVWDDGDMSDIIMDGQYYLKVNKATFTFDREKRDQDSFGNDLTIETNHKDGWQITRVTDPDNNEAEIDMDNGWLRILPADRKGEGDPQGNPSSKTIKLLLDENTGTSPRNAKIHLQVGRLLDFIVKVTQTTETILELSVEYLDGNPVSELFFHEYYGWQDTHEPKEIRVRWSPYGTGYDCNVEVNMSGDELFAFGSAATPITPGNLTDADGNHTYTIHPEPFKEDEVSQRLGNPFLHRGMRVTFRVTDKNNAQKSISKTIYLRHQHMAIISDDLRKAETQGQQGSFNIRSNTSWVIDEVVNEGILQTVPTKGTEGGNDIGDGDQLLYTTTSATTPGNMPAAGWAGRKATLYLRDTQGHIPGRIPFTITGVHNDPNSYILNPAGSTAARTVDIPIRKLFWAWDIYAEQDLGTINPTDLQAGTKWTAVYLNTDLNGPQQTYNIQTEIVHDNSNILEDILRVTIPYDTTVSGNAVVGVTHQGKWLYTWHIWITGYNPDSNNPDDTQTTRDAQFMNRNLGALETKAEEWRASTHGMFYQWGRKDPLQVSTITTGSPEVNTANNLGNTLNNPDLFYRATSGYQDWFTNREHRSYQNDYLWNDDKDTKGIFDPCPEDWRVTGTKWNGTTNQWTNMIAHSNSSDVTHTNGRLISREYYDNTINDPAVYFYAGAVDPAGNWERHTLSTGYPENILLYNCTPPHDNPSYGAGMSRLRNGINANSPFRRATAMPVRCTKENY